MELDDGEGQTNEKNKKGSKGAQTNTKGTIPKK